MAGLEELMGSSAAAPATRAWRSSTARHERAGSIRMHETVPFFSGRSGIEGVYNQSSLTTHPVYYLISELFPSSPNPFRSRTYSRFDLETALARLRLLNVSQRGRGERRARVRARRARRTWCARRSPALHGLPPGRPGARLRRAPRLRARAPPPRGWRDQAFRWFSRKPP